MKELTNKGARPDGTLTTQRSNTQNDQGGRHAERVAGRSPAETDAFYPAFWEKLIDKSRVSPSGEDPAFWPIYMLNEFHFLLVNRDYITSRSKAALVEKITPIGESIRKVTTAYEIIAYPHCKQAAKRFVIETQLMENRQLLESDSIELDDTELEIVRQLCETPRYALHRGTETLQAPIPFDPQKRIYNYSEVRNPSTSYTPVLAGK